VIYFGSTSPAMDEALDALAGRGHPPRRPAPARLPVPGRGVEFIAAHDTVFVVEQNRDAQMRTC
jgi:2-oxoglutarate ferredoxin oxidoreductase subunit alpha